MKGQEREVKRKLTADERQRRISEGMRLYWLPKKKSTPAKRSVDLPH